MKHSLPGYVTRGQEFLTLLTERILVLDGAMGTMLQARDLAARTSAAPSSRAATRTWSLTRPDVIRGIHEAYFAAAPTSSRRTPSAARRSCSPSTACRTTRDEINVSAAAGDRAVQRRCEVRPDRPRFVAGSMGPTHEDHLGHRRRHLRRSCVAHLRRAGGGAARGRRRLLLLETRAGHAQREGGAARRSTRRSRAGRPARARSCSRSRSRPMGTMLAGQIDRGALRLGRARAICSSIGLNCATGPEFMTDHLRTLCAALAPCRGLLLPERRPAGRERAVQRDAGDARRRSSSASSSKGWLNIVGGCCGTTPEHIRAMARRSRRAAATAPCGRTVRTHVSGIDYCRVEDDTGR